ncbi:MAG: AAA family ATPase [Minicystis sp.]
MLTRLKLHRFRYIKPGTELMFTERFNVLLGKNGTGKTTLLQLISMVLRSDFSQLRDEEFDIEYELSHLLGTGLIRFENKRKPHPPETSPRGGAKLRQHHPRVHATLRAKRGGAAQECEVEIDGAAATWRRGGGAWVESDAVDAFEGSLVMQISSIISSDGSELENEEFHQVLHGFELAGGWAYRFDESLEVFDSITDANRTPRPGRVPPISLETEERYLAGRMTFVPFEYRPVLPQPGQSSAKVELPTKSSLATFPVLSGIKTMTMSFAVEGSRKELDGRLWWTFGRAEFLFSGAKGSVFTHNVLSYGQKRLLAFLYYLDANTNYVIADELVNGMHHEWIHACLDKIGTRQAFLTSQNPLLLDYLPLESVEQVQRSFIQCRTEVVDDEPQIIWSNLAAEDAAELFADYQVGIQHVGEILRARGLW